MRPDRQVRFSSRLIVAHLISMWLLWSVPGWTVEPLSIVERKDDREQVLGPVRRMTITTKDSLLTLSFSDTGALTEKATRHRTDPPDEAGERVIYRYDTDGKITGKFAADSDTELVPLRLYAYDNDGRPIAEAAYHLCRTFSALHLYHYDEAKRLTEQVRFESRRLSRLEFLYDQNGRIERIRTHRNGRIFQITHYHYDQIGRLTSVESELPDGTIASITRYGYDDRGKVMTLVQHHPSDTARDQTEITAYEYDPRGNWTRRTTIRAVNPLDDEGLPFEEPVQITEREILYAEAVSSSER
ncbi:MAG: uncharacterized protein K0S45_494 [Nitrospira sp.]|jgi:YD repeat-containing protein|nr:uncharacterized protein [Nitrospira sp.]